MPNYYFRACSSRLFASHLAALLTFSMLGSTLAWSAPAQSPDARAGARVVMDAHNCYPYFGWWNDRIDRALSAGTPLAIEQDLLWYTDPQTGKSRSLVTHGAPSDGSEPSMRDYFFERVRPTVERALRDNDRKHWPLITLNLDLKSEEQEHLAAIWQLLTEYQDWITTARRTAQISEITPLDVKPILVFTGESEAQKAVFYDRVPIGSPLLVFGATPTDHTNPSAPPSTIAPNPSDNYHRWWNNPWSVVEPAGQSHAGEWTSDKEARLGELVRFAHQHGFWIRFYTLDGVSIPDESCRGIFHGYNFGSRAAVETRWQAAARAGVDYIATDQYEELGHELRGSP
jgi:hypothetical protein